MAVIYNPCEGSIIAPTCDPCLEDVENGRIRSVAFIHKDVVAKINSNPSDKSAWETAITNKKIFIIPQVIGTFDGGTPVEGNGYGDASTRLLGYNFSLGYKDPVFKGNCAFYNSISKDTNGWYVGFRTETLTRLSDKPVSVIPKSPVTEDLTSEVVWDVEVKWQQRDQPCPFETPDSIFTCVTVQA